MGLRVCVHVTADAQVFTVLRTALSAGKRVGARLVKA
jgi:hypothetical protein